MDREAWHAAIHGVAKSWTRLSDWNELNWTDWTQTAIFKVSPNRRKSCLVPFPNWYFRCAVTWDIPGLFNTGYLSTPNLMMFSAFPISLFFQCLTQVSSVQSLRHVRLFATPWIAARQASLSNTIYLSSLRLTSIESMMPSSHPILCLPLLFLFPIPHSIRVFSNESTLPMRWPTYWSFSLSIIPSKEHPGLISFRMDWLDLLAVQGTLKSLLQNHSSKASVLWCSAFFTVQLTSTHDDWKNHSLD